MLVLRREEGQWLEITHRSGDRLRICVYNIRSRFPGQLDMAFEDTDHHFDIEAAANAAGRESRACPVRPWPRRPSNPERTTVAVPCHRSSHRMPARSGRTLAAGATSRVFAVEHGDRLDDVCWASCDNSG